MEIAIATVIVGVLGVLRTLVPQFTSEGRRAARLRSDLRLAGELPEGEMRKSWLDNVARDLARHDQLRERQMRVRSSRAWLVVPIGLYLAGLALGIITATLEPGGKGVSVDEAMGLIAAGAYMLGGVVTGRMWLDARVIFPRG